MPVDQLVNPLAEENENASYGRVVEYFQYNPAASGNLQNGTAVKSIDLVAPSTGPILITSTSTSPDNRFIGIVVDAPTGGYAPGASVAVCVAGPCLALFDANNTVVNEFGIQGATTAGTLTISATATLGRKFIVVLEAVTIASGSALVPVNII
jgi:hypothetical protein